VSLAINSSGTLVPICIRHVCASELQENEPGPVVGQIMIEWIMAVHFQAEQCKIEPD
jgi:hypothetical protein